MDRGRAKIEAAFPLNAIAAKRRLRPCLLRGGVSRAPFGLARGGLQGGDEQIVSPF